DQYARPPLADERFERDVDEKRETGVVEIPAGDSDEEQILVSRARDVVRSQESQQQADAEDVNRHLGRTRSVPASLMNVPPCKNPRGHQRSESHDEKSELGHRHP